MFGKTKEAPQAQSDRYSVEVFHSAGKHETLAAGLEEAMNTGEDNGWTLAFITQHGGTFFIFWDTESSGPDYHGVDPDLVPYRTD